ncbi:MAG: class III extradiol ring-cleavage dioxygenase [Pseudomonadota bacterium]
MMIQPSLFISHGAPLLAIEEGPAHRFLKTLGQAYSPKAIIVVSAHHIHRGPAVTTDAAPKTIYDFGGFPDELYQLRYDAPGSPELAANIISALNAEGFEARGQSDRGFDHGAWVPLILMYPDAEIPVIQVSIDMRQSPEWHYRLGEALERFRAEGALIIGSGSITHNLQEWREHRFEDDADAPLWVTDFMDWIHDRLSAGDTGAVLSAVNEGPNGTRNHPSMDHILPLFVALGAGGSVASVKRLHSSTTYGVLGMDVYGFGA